MTEGTRGGVRIRVRLPSRARLERALLCTLRLHRWSGAEIDVDEVRRDRSRRVVMVRRCVRACGARRVLKQRAEIGYGNGSTRAEIRRVKLGRR